MTDFPDWQAPQAHATSIAKTGAPLLRLTTTLATGTTTLLGGGGGTLVSSAAITQPGFEAAFILRLPAAAGSIPFARALFTWFDSFSSTTIKAQEYFLTSGNGAGNDITTYLSGPCFGDSLTVQVFNLDPAQTLTAQFVINQTSHIYEHDHLYQPAYAASAPIGFTNPNGHPTAGVLAISTPTIGPSTTTGRLLAAWRGQALLDVDNGAQSNILLVSLVDPNNLYGGGINAELFINTVAAGQRAQFNVILPAGPVLLNMRNTGTTGNISITVSLVTLDL